MRSVWTRAALWLAAMVALVSHGAAQEAKNPAPVSRITPSFLIGCDLGRYPQKEVNQSREGWLTVRVTLDAAGAITNTEILSAFGRGDFEEAALQRLKNCEFKAASRDGVPIPESSLIVPMYFRIQGMAPGADSAFIRKIRNVATLAEEQRYDEAWRLLDELEASSTLLYEMAHVMLRRAVIAAARGDEYVALLYLQRLRYVKDLLPNREEAVVDRLRLRMELRAGRLIEAEQTVESINWFGKRDGDEALQQLLDKLRGVITQASTVGVKGLIPADCPDYICGTKPTWTYKPYFRTLSLTDIEGELTMLEGHCGAKHFTAVPQQNVTWTIPKSWGECTIEITGSPGTRFLLIDEAAAPQ